MGRHTWGSPGVGDTLTLGSCESWWRQGRPLCIKVNLQVEVEQEMDGTSHQKSGGNDSPA